MIEFLHCDSDIVVAVKEAGMLSEGEGEQCVPALIKAALAERGEDANAQLYTVHRLDRETEGIMVYARNSSSAAELSRQIQEDRWSKVYLALLCSAPDCDSGELCDLLYYDRTKSKTFVVKKERRGVKRAILSYSVISRFPDGRAAVRVSLKTGRTHQIRVQFASRGHSVCGDRRYGAPASSGRVLCLCAAELSFEHPVTGEPLEFRVEPRGFSIE